MNFSFHEDSDIGLGWVYFGRGGRRREGILSYLKERHTAQKDFQLKLYCPF